MPMTQVELNASHCATPGCDHADCGQLVLHGRCHPRAHTVTTYDKNRGVLIVTCARCDQLIAEVAVAARPENFFDRRH